jgi:hypothetical protein
MLHLTKVAFACESYEVLAARISARAATDGVLRVTTRYRPKRHEELIGGSLYWILRHRLVGRCEVTGFEEAEGGRTAIILDPRLIPVEPVPRRAHQGWRYLAEADAPRDLSEIVAAGDDLPFALTEQLAEIGLV